ncbi:hypothetical protein D9757_015467 [Collybiopsis confluens]|nr:hypothetical protein D9757_015467 [Collybiopsis confluens]
MNYFSIIDLPVSTAFSFRSAPAMALSSVCFRWRRNALAMPSIWSRISLKWSCSAVDHVPWGDESTFPLYLSLARSLKCPLMIELDFGKDPRLNHTSLHPIIAKFTQQSRRWKQLNLLYPGACILPDLFIGDTSPHFPLLEEVELGEVTASDPEVIFLARTAPNLKRLILNGDSELPHLKSLSAFTQITHMDFNPDLPHLVKFLKANPNLISLAVNEEAGSSSDHTAHPQTCARMEILTVRHDNGVGKSVFPAMHCPTLKSLEPLDKTPLLHAWDSYSLFMAFVRRSSFPLTTLSMKGLSLSDSNLVHVLTHLPTLVNLSIDDLIMLPPRSHITEDFFSIDDLDMLPPHSHITEEFIDSLHASRTSSLRSNLSPIIPRLRSLALSCGCSEFNDTSVVDMVKSRWFPSNLSGLSSETKVSNVFQVDCLREFALTFRRREKVDRAVYAPLERLEKNGMRVVVSWNST